MALTMDEVTANCMEMIGYTGEGRSLVNFKKHQIYQP